MDAMPARDLARWLAYFEIHPMPDSTRDAALVCCTIANVNRGEGQRPYRPEDFLPRLPGARREQSPEQMKAMFDLMGDG